MPVFATPEPIAVTFDVSAGDVRIVASDRADTAVEVRPSDTADDSDVAAAQQTRVGFADGTLTVRGPRSRMFDFSKRTRSVDVLIELPAGSRVHGDLAVGDVRSTGALGECRLTLSVGQVHLGRTGPLRLKTLGHVTVDAVDGDAHVTTGSGRVRIGEIAGGADVRSSNGHVEIGAVAGELTVRSANGDIDVDRAGAAADVRTSNGNVRLGRVVRDAVELHTSSGDLEIGVAGGTAAWLDLTTGHGRVDNALDDARGPEESATRVEVRASTGFGDITVRRS